MTCSTCEENGALKVTGSHCFVFLLRMGPISEEKWLETFLAENEKFQDALLVNSNHGTVHQKPNRTVWAIARDGTVYEQLPLF